LVLKGSDADDIASGLRLRGAKGPVSGDRAQFTPSASSAAFASAGCRRIHTDVDAVSFQRFGADALDLAQIVGALEGAVLFAVLDDVLGLLSPMPCSSLAMVAASAVLISTGPAQTAAGNRLQIRTCTARLTARAWALTERCVDMILSLNVCNSPGLPALLIVDAIERREPGNIWAKAHVIG
jgi:hypothetical protein